MAMRAMAVSLIYPVRGVVQPRQVARPGPARYWTHGGTATPGPRLFVARLDSRGRPPHKIRPGCPPDRDREAEPGSAMRQLLYDRHSLDLVRVMLILTACWCGSHLHKYATATGLSLFAFHIPVAFGTTWSVAYRLFSSSAGARSSRPTAVPVCVGTRASARHHATVF
jgi:hypothetical protein